MNKKTIKISGMHCAGCAQSVKKAIESISSIDSVSVNLATETATVEVRNGEIPEKDIQGAVEAAGYKLVETESDKPDKLKEKRARDEEKLHAARKNLIWSWIITGPVMIWMAFEMLFGVHLTELLVMETALTIAAAVVLFKPGWETLSSAWKSGKKLNPNMDVLIAIGTLASLSTGVLGITNHLGWIDFPMHSFAGIAAMIMAFHLTGRYVETKSKGRASDAIMKLLTLEAETARIIRNGLEEEITTKELQPGYVMVVRPGEKIPTDGKIIDGEGAVNEAMVTGESMPVRKEKGDEVIGGTINLEGSLKVQAVSVGEETFLNRVVRLVEEAQTTRVPIQEYADRITAVFVPVVLVFAAATFLIWVFFPGFFLPLIEWADGIIPWVEPDMGIWSQAFYAALAVLVIACPCALGLATPTALMIGSGLGAENGVLIRRGEAIQRMQEVTDIVFDKTGTLTEGEPFVTDLKITGNIDKTTLLELVFSAEHPSEHPLSRAIVQFAKQEGVTLHDVDHFKSYPGMGVTGEFSGRRVDIGNRKLMERQAIDIDNSSEALMRDLEKEGKTVVMAAVNGKIMALIALADKAKEGTSEVIGNLRKMGFRTAILTGDNRVVAEAIANQLGIERVFAEVLPDQKVGIIKDLQKEGGMVAMVGDGVNDAPALSQADVGIAIGTGTDIAIESGDIVLIDGNPEAVIKAVNLSRITFRKIRQNLFWAYFYNVIMIPVAVAGLMHPVLAEAAMAFSSVSVVTNSKRLSGKPIDR